MARLRGFISDSVTEIQIDDTTTLPVNGGVLDIESEKVSYTYATDKAVFGCTRGYDGTTPADHDDGTLVVAEDTVKPLYSLQEYSGSGAPIDNQTGVGFAFKGTRYTDLDSSIMYINNGDELEPEWAPFAEGEAAGASGPEGAVQLSDGAGHFVNDPMLHWDAANNVLFIGDDTDEAVALSVTSSGGTGGYIHFADEDDNTIYAQLHSNDTGVLEVIANGNTSSFNADGTFTLPDASTIGNSAGGLTLTSGGGGGLFLQPTGAVEIVPGVGNQNVDIFAVQMKMVNTGPGNTFQMQASNNNFFQFTNDDASTVYSVIESGGDVNGDLGLIGVERNVYVQTVLNDNTWTFNTDGQLLLPDGGMVSSLLDVVTDGTNSITIDPQVIHLRSDIGHNIQFENAAGAGIFFIDCDGATNSLSIGSAPSAGAHGVNFNDVGGDFVTDPSALIEMISTTKGFLPPRMTETERDAIATPAAGLVLYNTTTNKLNLYTTTWEVVTSA